MGLATLLQAQQWVEPGYGSCDPVALKRAVNRIRQEWYNWYSELGLFLDVTQCFAVQRFYLDCMECRDSYQGVTLPRDFQNVEAAWFNAWPLRLQSSWREWQAGISAECDCRLQKFDMPGSFCTALDPSPLSPPLLLVKAFDSRDVGKPFTLRGIAADGTPFEQTFSLSTEFQSTSRNVRALSASGGVVKGVTAGRTIIMDETGRVLGIQEPDETVPAYRRIKITGLGDCDCVNIRAARRYYPLSDDTDVVETDNAVAFDAMARYLRIYEKSDKTREDIANEQNFLLHAKGQLIGEKSREVGKATQASLTVLTPRFGGNLSRSSGRRFGMGGGYRTW